MLLFPSLIKLKYPIIIREEFRKKLLNIIYSQYKIWTSAGETLILMTLWLRSIYFVDRTRGQELLVMP